jgi:hypothetical protein
LRERRELGRQHRRKIRSAPRRRKIRSAPRRRKIRSAPRRRKIRSAPRRRKMASVLQALGEGAEDPARVLVVGHLARAHLGDRVGLRVLELVVPADLAHGLLELAVVVVTFRLGNGPAQAGRIPGAPQCESA